MSHNFTLIACKDMLKELEKEMIEIDQQKRRLQIIIDKKKIQCGKSSSSSSKSSGKSKKTHKSKPTKFANVNKLSERVETGVLKPGKYVSRSKLSSMAADEKRGRVKTLKKQQEEAEKARLKAEADAKESERKRVEEEQRQREAMERKSQSKRPSMSLQSENYTSKAWDELMKDPQNKIAFELSRLNKLGLNLKRPDYWAKNPVNHKDLERLIETEKVEETHLPIMIAAFKNYSRTEPRNKRGYHRTNGLLNNAYKYFKEYPNDPMFLSFKGKM
jgi:hypothetical protein